ncbi:MAG: NAD-dependent epimerase/dehydratase family protein [Archangiaceae bacterium]|nr:NAD-dependent epimerase/dehydratase family protein [Archangiaceae bacterium]
MKVLLVGVAGGTARACALTLRERGHEVVGLDRRPWRDAPKGIRNYEVDLRKRAAEDVFRKERPEVVVHMATVTSLTRPSAEEREKVNLGGTRAVFEHSLQHGVKHVVFVGRHTYYGAAADSAMYHVEDEPPMALGTFPELADLVAADLYASTALWRHPEVKVSVLRCCYTLGPSKTGTLATFLRGKRVPMVLGYDPLFQFMYEQDFAVAVSCAVEKGPRGVFNVAGPHPVPLSDIARATGRSPFPVPEVLLNAMTGRFGLPALPRGALEHIKYPVIVDATAFAKATGFQWEVDEVETLSRYRALGI